MNKDEIIRMAREAGLISKFDTASQWVEGTDLTLYIERFAALVAAAEREKVARWQIGSGYSTGHGDTIEDLLVELEWQVRESEREACAKVCEAEWRNVAERMYGEECAAAIRARGQK